MKNIKQKIHHQIFYLIITLSIIACSSDSKETDEPYIPIDEITASDKDLIPDKETKSVSTILNFENIDKIDFILVKKSGNKNYNQQIKGDELKSNYIFISEIKSSDPESFKILLSAYYKDGNISKELALSVDNRWGFFIRKVSRISRITGNPMSNENIPNPNNTAIKWNVGGTDLGIIWEMDSGKYGIFFGDTFGRDFTPNISNPGPNGGSWRSNVLAFSENQDLEKGLSFSRMVTDNAGNAREIILGGKDGSGKGDWTSIPTAAIRANGTDYVHYFNMKNWTGWVTNYSGMYKSVDNGVTWIKCEHITFGANSLFGQVGYFKKGGYVYMIGTQTGRDSKAQLARFKESDIENLNQYEYWNGDTKSWIKGDENQATVIIDDKVGELSFIYNETHKKWIIAYFNGDRYNITMRTAADITDSWSDPFELASGYTYAQLYGSFFHPLSTIGSDLYFTLSMWLPYNVFLMKATIADMGEF